MTKERLELSRDTILDNIKILEDCAPKEPGALLELEHQKHILELLQAELDGRLTVLPCNVGDTVYYKKENEVVESFVKGFDVNKYRTAFYTDLYGGYFIDIEFLNETVFLTREEAEKALEEAKTE